MKSVSRTCSSVECFTVVGMVVEGRGGGDNVLPVERDMAMGFRGVKIDLGDWLTHCRPRWVRANCINDGALVTLFSNIVYGASKGSKVAMKR